MYPSTHNNESFTIQEAKTFFEDDYYKGLTKTTNSNRYGILNPGDFTPYGRQRYTQIMKSMLLMMLISIPNDEHHIFKLNLAQTNQKHTGYLFIKSWL